MCVCAYVDVHYICSGVHRTGVKGGCELCYGPNAGPLEEAVSTLKH